MEFREASVTLTQALSKDTKQAHGIFFTPKTERDALFKVLDAHKVRPTSILEPSFGSGEFLYDLCEKYPKARVTGVELNTDLFNACKLPHALNMDFLEYKGKHDLIIGNPPYFVIPKDERTTLCQTGRPNMFVQFLYKAIEENLTDTGYLAFVLPTSLYNSAYYEPMRHYLFNTTTVLAVLPLDGKYLDTQQPTFGLVIRKGKRPHDYIIQRNGSHYLTPYSKELCTLLQASTTLTALGFRVSTGDVVWNQVKDNLVDTDGTLLIYSSNLKKGKLVLSDEMTRGKKQYVTGLSKQPIEGVSILMNRGYGNAKYMLTPVLVDMPSYYAENHVNVIRPTTDESRQHVEAVYKSLQSKKTQKFIDYFVGNNALSKTELEACLPIWI